MFIAEIFPIELEFNKPAKTSRNTLTHKKVYLLKLCSRKSPGTFGLGEISPFEGLSIDDGPDFLPELNSVVSLINEGIDPRNLDLQKFPSILFGLETALNDLRHGGQREVFVNDFSKGQSTIPINGLIWMGSTQDMLKQVEEKLDAGFRCIKMKIGALDFDEECRLLETIRKKYSPFQVELRVDANGAFPFSDALSMLKELSRFHLHSIEQPIRQGNWDLMEELCAKSPLPIALDEELLGVPEEIASKLCSALKPAYLIIKPGLLGGFEISKHWISVARAQNIGWWITSALESNVGLNAIAQFAANYELNMPQGLGTGLLFKNNIPCPLEIVSGHLANRKDKKWQLPF